MEKNDEANRSWLRVNRSFPPSNEVVFFHQAAKSTNYIFIYSTMRHTARDDSHGHDAGYTWCTHARSRRFIISLREYRLKPELVIIIRVIIYECKEGGIRALLRLSKKIKRSSIEILRKSGLSPREDVGNRGTVDEEHRGSIGRLL